MGDPILTPSNQRFTTFPIRYPDLWELYKNAESSFWRAEEIDLSKDLKDWDNLNFDEQYFIKMVLAFFSFSDGIVNENIELNFVNEVHIPEAIAFYKYQGYNESIHGQTYSLLIEKLVRDPIEKAKLFNAYENFPCVNAKAKWALNWAHKNAPFEQRLVAFACVEGLFFSGSFCAIFWLKKRGLMPGFSFSNELISRDESMHQEFAVALHSHLQKKCDPVIICSIVKSAIEIEKQFIFEALPVSLIGMNSRMMAQYLEFVADRLLLQFGCPKIYNVENPFDWMVSISLEGKTNFFEKRVGEYNKHAIVDGDDFSIDADF
jgi:ribonucleotide reductase beta subunit family protein with ferritin-like domain